MNSLFKITCLRDGEAKEYFDAPEYGHVFIIGRDDDAAIKIDESDVSRRHVTVMRDANGWIIVDQSANGTWVNNKLMKQKGVCINDCVEIRCGKTSLLLPKPSEMELSKDGGVEKIYSKRLSEVDFRRLIHRRLLDSMKVEDVAALGAQDCIQKKAVQDSIEHILSTCKDIAPTGIDLEKLKNELLDEILGLGPLESLLKDDDVTEIMVVDSDTIFCERSGMIKKNRASFTDDDALRTIINRIVAPLGRRIDDSSPYVDARLKDGSRVNAVVSPVALRGSCLTIRKFPKKRLKIGDLIQFNSLNKDMANF